MTKVNNGKLLTVSQHSVTLCKLLFTHCSVSQCTNLEYILSFNPRTYNGGGGECQPHIRLVESFEKIVYSEGLKLSVLFR